MQVSMGRTLIKVPPQAWSLPPYAWPGPPVSALPTNFPMPIPWMNPVNGRMNGWTAVHEHFCNSMYFGSEICMAMDAIHGQIQVFEQLGFRDTEYSRLWTVLKIHVVSVYYCSTPSIIHGF